MTSWGITDMAITQQQQQQQQGRNLCYVFPPKLDFNVTMQLIKLTLRDIFSMKAAGLVGTRGVAYVMKLVGSTVKNKTKQKKHLKYPTLPVEQVCIVSSKD